MPRWRPKRRKAPTFAPSPKSTAPEVPFLRTSEKSTSRDCLENPNRTSATTPTPPMRSRSTA